MSVNKKHKLTAKSNGVTARQIEAANPPNDDTKEFLDGDSNGIEKRIASILNANVDNEEKLGQIVQTVRTFEAYSGPIPHPKHLREFAEIMDDKGEKIMQLATQEQTHRHDMDLAESERQDNLNTASIKRAYNGQWMSYSLLTIFVTSSMYILAFTDRNAAISLIPLVGSALSVIAPAVTARIGQSKNKNS